MKRLYALTVLVALAMLAPVSALAGGVPWGEPINTPDRFIVLSSYQDKVVFDAETGLAWERSPDGFANSSWPLAQQICNSKTVGNRKGWRLPTLQELASLLDPTMANPALPAGNPFLGVNVGFTSYWSGTTVAFSANPDAWIVAFGSNGAVGSDHKSANHFAWCVRGGQGVDPQ
jgi:uncharacterized protein DUF1566